MGLLKVLRRVFLQDSVLLKKVFPGHRIWKHDLFQGAEYKEFERKLTAAMLSERDPTELSLERTMPELMEYLKASGQSQRQDIQILKDVVAKNTAAVDKNTKAVASLRNMVNDMAKVVQRHMQEEGGMINLDLYYLVYF